MNVSGISSSAANRGPSQPPLAESEEPTPITPRPLASLRLTAESQEELEQAVEEMVTLFGARLKGLGVQVSKAPVRFGKWATEYVAYGELLPAAGQMATVPHHAKEEE